MHAYSSNFKDDQRRSYKPSLTSIHIANKRTSIAIQGQHTQPFDETTTWNFLFRSHEIVKFFERDPYNDSFFRQVTRLQHHGQHCL